MKSASLAVDVLGRQLKQQPFNWEKECVAPLKIGIGVFRAFVTSWYDVDLHDVVFLFVATEKHRLFDSGGLCLG